MDGSEFNTLGSFLKKNVEQNSPTHYHHTENQNNKKTNLNFIKMKNYLKKKLHFITLDGVVRVIFCKL